MSRRHPVWRVALLRTETRDSRHPLQLRGILCNFAVLFRSTAKSKWEKDPIKRGKIGFQIHWIRTIRFLKFVDTVKCQQIHRFTEFVRFDLLMRVEHFLWVCTWKPNGNRMWGDRCKMPIHIEIWRICLYILYSFSYGYYIDDTSVYMETYRKRNMGLYM